MAGAGTGTALIDPAETRGRIVAVLAEGSDTGA